MTQQAPVNPTLPQNDPASERALREAQLAQTQKSYEWTIKVPSLPGVPAVAKLPAQEDPTLEWWLKLVRVVLQLASNQIALEEQLIAQDLAGLDPLALDADKALIAAVEKDVAAIEAKIWDDIWGKKGLGTIVKEGIDLVLVETAVSDLKNHADKLQTIIERDGAIKTATGSDDPRSLDTYRDIFKTIDLPAIAFTFEDDLEFANLRVAGPNSVLIEAVSAVPRGCAITPQQYASVVPGDTLANAVAEGRLFQCDYKDLATIDPGTWEDNAKYLTCPVALFAVPPGTGSLVPVAINCDPSNPASPVITPSLAGDRQWAWQMAKFCVQAADGNYHELFAHLARTHLVIEAVAIATHRQLAEEHPLWALLVRHYEGTMFINEAAATSLITKGGPIDHIFAGTIESSQQTAAGARLSFDFTKGMLPADIAARGVGPDSALTDYPYRDDGLLVWNAIEEWVGDYIRVYYASDADVAGDTELAAWSADIAANGNLKGFSAPTTIAELVATCTMIVFTGSAQHAAVNFPQKAIMEFAPAVTGAMWQTAPDTFEGQDKTQWLAMMPPRELAIEQLKVLFLLGSIYYRPLGTYLSPQFPYPQWFRDPQIIGEGGPLDRFNAALQNVEATITERNANRRRPYTVLLPSLIPSSTNI
ncbi:lipoxygenase family protein [Erythrobacter sp. GH1-10]|uniref:lipoxygenase family protein n=1 Tax=Erythrobacter sp. GH1-10 TaxID=3349334 RepID=UPI00387813EE